MVPANVDALAAALAGPDAGSRTAAALALLQPPGAIDAATLDGIAASGLLPALLPDAASPDAAALLALVLPAAASSAATARAVAGALVARSSACDQGTLDRLVLGADDAGTLPALFAALIADGLYDPFAALLSRGVDDSPSLRALAAARPDYGQDALNAPTVDLVRTGVQYPTRYDLLIVPGYTPVDARQPLPISAIAPARQRVELAARDLKSGVGRYVLLTGGAVHPPGTRYVEALEMRAHLVTQGVAPNRILVEPYARHSTTNLRNAGRYMRQLGLATSVIVTGFDGCAVSSQTFYFAHDVLSSFQSRCRSELGYVVGETRGVDDNHVAFSPAPEVERRLWRDPLDA